MPKFVRQGDNTLIGNNTFEGDDTFSGTTTHSGTLDITGTLELSGTALTATAAELNNAADNSANVEVVTATNVITAAESGKTFYLSAVAGFESTLPTAAAGLRFKFVVKTAPTSNGYTITGTPAAKIQGLVSSNGAETEANGILAADEDNVIFVANQALVGDYVEFNSDGTNWYVSGMVAALAGLTANT